VSVPVTQPPAAVSAAAEPGRSVAKRIGNAVSWVVSILIIAAALLMLVPALLGLQRYVIVSGSMEPTIPTGSVVYDEAVPVPELKVGDVITFLPPKEFEFTDPVTHRIVDISPVTAGSKINDEAVPSGSVQIHTKGDANEDVDPWAMVPDQPEMARVKFHIPWLGYVYMALSNRWVQLLVIGLPALVIGIMVVVALWREAGDGVAREQAEQAAATADSAAAETEKAPA
jgi:signal peptidase